MYGLVNVTIWSGTYLVSFLLQYVISNDDILWKIL